MASLRGANVAPRQLLPGSGHLPLLHSALGSVASSFLLLLPGQSVLDSLNWTLCTNFVD